MPHKGNNYEEEHNTGTDRYLITYADLITLLLGLFVILYATSQVDEEKYKEVSAALSQYFKPGDNKILEGGKGIFAGIKPGLPEPVITRNSARSLKEIEQETGKALDRYVAKGDVKIKLSGKLLVLTLPEKLLFESGKAEIRPEGQKVLDTLARVFVGIPYQIAVEGHTDSDPIRTFRYESNWHLSLARAMNVAWKLIRNGAPENNLRVGGYGSQRPVADNSTDEGKLQNRRVEITISELPADVPSTSGYTQGDDSSGKR